MICLSSIHQFCLCMAFEGKYLTSSFYNYIHKNNSLCINVNVNNGVNVSCYYISYEKRESYTFSVKYVQLRFSGC